MEEQRQQLRYLIIDDFDQMRVSFKGMLTSYGATDVTTCSSGEKAIKLLANNSYDVVICDYNLGDGKDGQQVLEEVRHLGYLGHAATFFMITAESNMPMVMSALEHQPDDYMIKPINRDVLHHRLTVALKRKTQLRPIDEALVREDKVSAIAMCRERSGKDLKQRLYLAKLQAELCLEIKRYDEAEEIYREILAIRDFPWALFGLAKINFLIGEYKKAEAGLRALLEQNHLYLEVYDWLVELLQKRDESVEAQQLLEEAVMLSPKAVARQRKLGLVAEANGDIERAERAYQAAIRWGKNSCFASALEYRRLAEIYQNSGNAPKVVRLLVEGRKRFSNQPAERIRMLCGQALAHQQQGMAADVDLYLDEAMHLLDECKREVTAKHLLEVADDLFRLSRPEEAQSVLKLLLSNHHDDERWIERVRQLMLSHGREQDADDLVAVAKCELQDIHVKCTQLIRSKRLDQAITLLNDTIERYPRNRTLVLMAAGAMISHMRENGLDQGYHFRCRFSLNRLLEKDSQDPEADRFMKMLNQISPLAAEGVLSGQNG
jgi:DNA-binding response OmpR family regulator